jgi:hypothetical protein
MKKGGKTGINGTDCRANCTAESILEYDWEYTRVESTTESTLKV